MDDSLQARIEHEVAELRTAYPQITGAHAVLESWEEGSDRHYALLVDIRLPQHQSIVNGGMKDSAYAAMRAGFDAAHERMAAIAARSA
jgi:hypothetical protein